MICTTIHHKTYQEILSILDDPFVEMAEIRLDLCELSEDEIKDLFGSSEKPLVATYRVGREPGLKEFNSAWEKALRKMSQAVVFLMWNTHSTTVPTRIISVQTKNMFQTG